MKYWFWKYLSMVAKKNHYKNDEESEFGLKLEPTY